MDYRHTIWLIVRLILILAVMMSIPLASSFVESNQLIFTYLVIALILIFQVIELVFFLNRSNRELTRFLEHIKNRDFNLQFNEKESRGARKKLHKTFNEVLETYKDIRIEKEVHFRFLEHIIELIEIGIMVFDQNGNVVLVNTAAENLIGVPSPQTWEKIKKKNPEFVASVGSIENSGHTLFESKIPGTANRLAIQVSRTRMLEDSYSLMAIQDIKGMVEQKETGAWIRLLRTLNHEIKNSVTPISSLTDTILMILQNEDGQYKSIDEISPQNLSDIITSMETLQLRNKSLHAFIEEYHKLTRIPAPDPEMILCETLYKETAAFFKSELLKRGIMLILDVKEKDQEIKADRQLIEQVLINLVKNSMDALEDRPNPGITLASDCSSDKVTLSVSDNGAGIDDEILEDIFVPFYSTKSHGSGIGLSLVRQIMRLHGGNVKVTSIKGEGTVVSLIF